MDHVHVNAASRPQLAALLGLTTGELDALLAARPFADVEALRAALPARARPRARSLELTKLDINVVDEEALVRRAGIPAELSRRIVDHRPYYFMEELRALPGIAEVYESLVALFCVPALAYIDKLTERSVRLTPDLSRVVLSTAEDGDERDAQALARRDFRPAAGERAARRHALLDAPRGAPLEAWSELSRDHGGRVFPGFHDRRGRRYLDPGYCVVQFADGVDAATQAAILEAEGLTIHERMRDPGLVLLRCPPGRRDPGSLSAILAALCARPEVRFAEPNHLGFDDADDFDLRDAGAAPPGEPWNLREVQAPTAWSRTRGSDRVVIAVIDSGVDVDHPALRGALLEREGGDDWNFADDDDALPTDTSGHGTFIAGLLVGNGEAGIRGICPGCRVLPLKIPLRGEKNGYARRRDAILYALRRAPAGARLVINLSWKTAGDVALIRDAIDQAVERGAIVVASAGNWPSREDEPHFPSDYRAAISVAATGPDRRRAIYSYYGDEVDVAAPGGGTDDVDHGILGAAPGGGVIVGAGTSFAAPHIAGVAALMLSHDPTLTVAQVRAALESTATRLEQPGMGSGLVDAAAALQAITRAAAEPTRDAPAPTPAPTPAPPPTPAARAVVAADAAAVVGEPDASETGSLGEGLFDRVLEVLRWRPRPGLHRGLVRVFHERLRERFDDQVAAFVRAGVGARLARQVAALPGDAWPRLLTAPAIANRLLYHDAHDLRLLLDSTQAELLRDDPPARLDAPVWSALGDLYLPAGAIDRAALERTTYAPWRPDRPFRAARLDPEIILDFDSPHARRPMLEIVEQFTPYDGAAQRALIQRFRAGMASVQALAPVHELVRSYARAFVLRDDPTRRSWSNSSYERFTGRVVCVNPHLRAVDGAEVAEIIVHESIHSFIYVIEEWYPLIPDRARAAEVKATSTWSGRALALHAFVHACFVWFGLLQFWRLAGREGVFPRDHARARGDAIAAGFADPALVASFEAVADHFAPEVRAALRRVLHGVPRGAFDG